MVYYNFYGCLWFGANYHHVYSECIYDLLDYEWCVSEYGLLPSLNPIVYR